MPGIGALHAQDVRIGVNGLTCSQCTRSVEMQLRKLDFVKDVKMDLEHTNGAIVLKENKKFDPYLIAKAITDAGFSVRFVKLLQPYPADADNSNGCFTFKNINLQMVSTSIEPSGNALMLLGSQFLPREEYKKWKGKLVQHCSGDVYFVTIAKDAE